MGYTTQAITDLYESVKRGDFPAAINAGSYGPQPGYHGARAELPPTDYSVQRDLDKQGDPYAGAAIDITLYDPDDMARATGRLIDAILARDPRVRGLREFFGTLDGVNVTGMDSEGYYVTSDDTHLWHIHASIYRAYTNDDDAMQDLAAVMNGYTTQEGGDDMPERVRVSADHRQQLRKGEASTIAFTHAISDPGKVWGGAGQDPDGKYPALKLADRAYVSTLTVTIDELPSDASIVLALQQDDGDGDVNVGPRDERRGTSGTTQLTYTRAGFCQSGYKLECLANPSRDCQITKAEWFVLYW